MDSLQVRKKFLEYFEKNGHTLVASSSLVPAQDPTLLFTNAGMNQFKDCFLGREKRSYVRATSIQKCVRAGGKHNDLDQVGFTARHMTFFEMMGNFSFGDYFKKEAIKFAWDFLTNELNLDVEKLYVTVFKDDDESHSIWTNEIGIVSNKLFKLDEKDNFWQMGDIGPCGPCSEIYFDLGSDVGCGSQKCQPGCDCSRYTEIWNLVFMQYDRQPDGNLKPLETVGVDTGMGFERLCMVAQGKRNIYHVDFMTALIESIESLANVKYAKNNSEIQATFHVLADHIRSTSLIIADGCMPSNDGRGYVLRKIIRRAALFAQKLSGQISLFAKLAEPFIDQMSGVYPELSQNRDKILKTLNSEIDRFAVNLSRGQEILSGYIDENRNKDCQKLSGQQVFKLYDTFGFPPELTNLIAKDYEFDIDMVGFESEMKRQKEQSGKKCEDGGLVFDLPANATTVFVGYDYVEIKSIIQFVQQGDGYVWISTKESPFYVESGGQVSDRGFVEIDGMSFDVIDLKKVFNADGLPVMLIKLSIDSKDLPLKEGDSVGLHVDQSLRSAVKKNHTATHILQAAMHEVLGSSVKQAGSLVTNEYLRFDYRYEKHTSKDEIEKIEKIVNFVVQQNIETNIYNTTLDEAKQKGVTAIFGEKYNPEDVRVVEIPAISSELCGGIHVCRTGDIGCFKITSDSSLSTGVRRISAVTGKVALVFFEQCHDVVKHCCEMFKVKPEQVLSVIEKQNCDLHNYLKEIKQLKKELVKSQIPVWLEQFEDVAGVPFLYLEIEGHDRGALKDVCLDLIKKKEGFCFAINRMAGEIAFLGCVSKKFEDKVQLKPLAKSLKDSFGMKGGGNSSLIQGGADIVPAEFKNKLVDWIKEKE
jgi:alanyl-tRNA synthetase